ncbi:MAG: 1-(5-phosphoribosyl)-5-[(5-phosphoribosylamino) me thylideneamino] imidazole-4-carboxamide isomerase [Hyphobacterium sp.]|nr:MAG: 1-(5-phosphoribosyl)-5-[(5-phosphoribosylamino) me thylideneamino] imidazole-4-carboxamide isomerase [Hyphobacterium sp.]
MIFYPAIDLLDGQVVRLSKGNFASAKAYSDDPLTIANEFAEAGADWIHVVDLSGARDGALRQTHLVQQLAAIGLKIQAGGGIRSEMDISRMKDAGVQRVIIGSRAIETPDIMASWLETFGSDALVAALDLKIEAKQPILVTEGWTNTTGKHLGEVLAILMDAGLRHALVTDVGRDGLMAGPNTKLYAQLATRHPDIDWQASGGVGDTADLLALRTTGIAGVITGRALYENRFSVTEAVSCLQNG